MKMYFALDDSRRVDGGGAGETLALLTSAIENQGWGHCSLPSRHRLYPHPESGCKKHNTARSFSADIETQYLNPFIEYAGRLIQSHGSPDSNTGMAIAVPEQMQDLTELIDYAYRAKEGLVTREEVLMLADRPGLYIQALSGNGNGIIGALAAVGLRMTGNDGQFRGKLKLGSGEGYITSAADILQNTYVEQIKTMDMMNICEDESIRMGEKVKIVLMDHKYTLMVFPTDMDHPKWQTSTTHMLRAF